MERAKRFHVLDGFRGLCALSIVIFHMHLPGSVTELGFFRNAGVFVAFFFVLSGFVLAHAYGGDGYFKFDRFLISRTFRLYPLHLFMLVIFVFLEFGKLLAAKYGIVFNSPPFTGVTAPSELLPNIFLLQSWSSLFDKFSFNSPSWSISVEFYLYIIFAATLLLLPRFKLISWVVLSVLAASFLYVGGNVFTDVSLKGISFFFMGGVSYFLYKFLCGGSPLAPWLVTVLEAVLLLVVVLCVSLEFEFQTLVLGFVFAGATVLFAFEGGFFSRLLKRGFFVLMGRLSYSIYLTHFAILFCVAAVFTVAGKVMGVELSPVINGVRYLDLGSSLLNNMVVLFVVLFVVAVSSITYRYVEVPGQALGRRVLGLWIARGAGLKADQKV